MRAWKHFPTVWGIPFLLAVCLFAFPVQAQYSGGTGTADDPYQIATAADLIALGATPADYDKHFILTADIDLDPNLPSGKVFDKAVIAPDTDPVKDWFQGTGFTGVFDGKGHGISHLTIRGDDFVGLFGFLGPGAEVRGLGVVDVNATGSGSYVGGLVGENWGGAVTQCYGTGAVSGQDYVGGLVGDNGIGAMTQCHSTGAVSGSYMVGGLVGRLNFDCLLVECYSSGVVTGISAVGGLVGYDDYGGTVTHCYSTGAVKGTGFDVGGLVGGGSANNVTACFWDIQSSGRTRSAGGTDKTTAQMQTAKTFLDAGWDFVGEIQNGTSEIWQMPQGNGYPVLAIFHGYAPPQLKGLGTADDPYLISNALELGAVRHYSPYGQYRLATRIDLSGISWGTAVIPRFAGVFDGNNLTISHLTIQGGSHLGLFGQLALGAEAKDLGVVDVNIAGSGDVGGLAGYSEGMATRCYSTGAVGGTGISGVGGLVGQCSTGAVVTQCYSAGAVRGSSGYVGGLVGRNEYNSRVTCCYSTGTVSGTQSVGGLVGFNWGAVTQCYSTGALAGTGWSFGGLVGGNWQGTVTSSFWDAQTSGRSTSAGGTGKTTVEMQTGKTFLDAGWDFVGETKNGTEDIWWIDEGKDYPRLWWKGTADERR